MPFLGQRRREEHPLCLLATLCAVYLIGLHGHLGTLLANGQPLVNHWPTTGQPLANRWPPEPTGPSLQSSFPAAQPPACTDVWLLLPRRRTPCCPLSLPCSP